MVLICGILAVLCLLYYVLIATYAGPMVSFGFFWIALAIVFCVLAWFFRKHDGLPGRLGIMVSVILGVCLLAFLILEGVLVYHGCAEPAKDADYMIVLGAKVNGTRPSVTLSERLEAAYEYAVANENTKIIVSGGQGPSEFISEARAMADDLIQKGISPSRILLEEQSTNTDENIRFSKALIAQEDAKIVIVTNGFHVFRGKLLCQKNGLKNVTGLGAATPWRLILNSYVREAFAVCKDFL